MILKDGKFWDDKGNDINIVKLFRLWSHRLNHEGYLLFVAMFDRNNIDNYRGYEHEIYETAMETFYGDKVWGYINDKLK